MTPAEAVPGSMPKRVTAAARKQGLAAGAPELAPGPLRQQIEAGLLAPAAHIAPKFFYDDMGSRLFSAICLLPEYYPTRTEADIFSRHVPAMAQAVRHHLGRLDSLIDLGAGDCAKAARLFEPLEPRRYAAVDVSEAFVSDAVQRLQAQHPAIAMQALARDLSQAWALPDDYDDAGRLYFYPGSSIGNFSPDEAVAFLRRINPPGSARRGLLIGVDMVKPVDVLEPAYDDALGVTAAFNLNILRHVNRLIGADFDLRDWRHVAFFDRQHSRIEMHLEAIRSTDVAWPSGGRGFVAGERILTEYSYKYEGAAFEAMLRAAGFRVEQVWHDERRWFGVYLALSQEGAAPAA